MKIINKKFNVTSKKYQDQLIYLQTHKNAQFSQYLYLVNISIKYYTQQLRANEPQTSAHK